MHSCICCWSSWVRSSKAPLCNCDSNPIEGVSFQLWSIPIDVTGHNPWLRIQNISIKMNKVSFLSLRVWSKLSIMQLWFIPIEGVWWYMTIHNPWLRIQNMNIKVDVKIHSNRYYSNSSVSVGIYIKANSLNINCDLFQLKRSRLRDWM